jgi:hypothetical protein
MLPFRRRQQGGEWGGPVSPSVNCATPNGTAGGQTWRWDYHRRSQTFAGTRLAGTRLAAKGLNKKENWYSSRLLPDRPWVSPRENPCFFFSHLPHHLRSTIHQVIEPALSMTRHHHAHQCRWQPHLQWACRIQENSVPIQCVPTKLESACRSNLLSACQVEGLVLHASEIRACMSAHPFRVLQQDRRAQVRFRGRQLLYCPIDLRFTVIADDSNGGSDLPGPRQCRGVLAATPTHCEPKRREQKGKRTQRAGSHPRS